jgi:protein phosphatase
MFSIVYSELTDSGRKRESNEDAMAIFDPMDSGARQKKGVLFALADGLGGLENGEVASGMAVLQINHLYKELREFRDIIWLREAIQNANRKVHRANLQVEEDQWMATTLTVSLFLRDHLYVGHVGDCRLYQARAGKLTRLTTDHSTDRYTLTRTIGIEPAVHVDLLEIPLEKDDIYLQCSDGLYAMIPDEEILPVLSGYGPDDACRHLVDLANQKGGADNITVQVIKVL